MGVLVVLSVPRCGFVQSLDLPFPSAGGVVGPAA